MRTVLNFPNADVILTTQPDGTTKILVEPQQGFFVPIRQCQTDYPMELIRLILETKGADYLCDEINRDIDPNYVQRDLQDDLTAYFTNEDFEGKRILDFGCGSGASSMVLARMFPTSEIVGVELEKELLEIARARLEFYDYNNIQFHLSVSGEKLPPNIGEFDFVILSAVYEHLLPQERQIVLPQIWSIVKPKGYFFINNTPHRWFPIEHHTTGLPLINYLPDKLALAATRKFSNRIDPTEPWEILLRRGIRGATENEILFILKKESAQGSPVLLEPSLKQLNDRIDLWFSALDQQRHTLIKKTIKILLKSLRKVSGITLVPNLSLVIQKD